MKTTFESESDALAVPSNTPTTAQAPATTPPNDENKEAPVPVAGNGAPDYSQVEVNTEPELPTPDKAGGSATEPESGGGYSG